MIDLKKIIRKSQEALNNVKTQEERQKIIYDCAEEIYDAFNVEIFDGEDENPMSMEMTISVASALVEVKRVLIQPYIE